MISSINALRILRNLIITYISPLFIVIFFSLHPNLLNIRREEVQKKNTNA